MRDETAPLPLVALRDFTIADAPFLLACEQDPTGWLESAPDAPPLSLADVQRYIVRLQFSAPSAFRRQLAVDREGQPVGVLDFMHLNEPTGEAEVALCVWPPEKRGLGYGRAILVCAAAYAEEKLAVARLTALIHVDKTASISCFSGANFIRVGLLKKWVKGRNGIWEDAYIYSRALGAYG